MSGTVAIIGAGAVGLTTAIALAERGFGVVVYAQEPSQGTIASRVAPALFTPYPGPVVTERFKVWAAESVRRLHGLAELDDSGVFIAPLREYFYSPRVRHAWLDELLWTRPLAAPAGVEGVVGERVHVDTTRYIDWLEARARETGVRFVTRHVNAFAEIHGAAAIVNCAGLGARALTGDARLAAMRGVVVHIPNDIGLEYSVHDDAPAGKVAYIFRFRGHLVLGGTFEEAQENFDIEDELLPALLQRCRRLLEVDGHSRWRELSLDRALRTLVALRPVRLGPGTFENVRLELVRDGAVPVVHNYGHGRQGITVSWGTAMEAADLVTQAMREA